MKRLLLLALIWGWSFLFIKVAVEGFTPPTVAFLRVALGAAVLRIWLRSQRVRLPRDPAYRRWVVLVAVVANALPFTLLAWGEQRISSGLTAVVNASTPLFTAVAARVVLGDRLRPGQIAGLLIGFVGVSVAAGFGVSDLTGSSAFGAGASVAAGACYGLAFAWMRRHLTGVPPAVAAGGQLTAAALLLAPFALVTSLVDGFDATPRRVGAVLLLGVVGTGVAYLLNYRIIAELGATRASLVTYVIPVVAVAVGIVFLDETFEVRLLVGGALIAAGITLVNRWSLLSRRVPGPATVAGLLVVAALGATTLAGCGDDSGEGSGASITAGASGCEAERREALDPASAVHVLGGAVEPEYTTDPPTSGPHEPAPMLSGIRDEPLSRPNQVGHLEAGGVLLQYSPDLDQAQVARLQGLAGYGVVVAPNPDLPAPVVATAWVVKQSCDSADIDELVEFVGAHWGDAPGSDG
jgi:drug/metabolite transporter (DMT)-like permease